MARIWVGNSSRYERGFSIAGAIIVMSIYFRPPSLRNLDLLCSDK